MGVMSPCLTSDHREGSQQALRPPNGRRFPHHGGGGRRGPRAPRTHRGRQDDHEWTPVVPPPGRGTPNDRLKLPGRRRHRERPRRSPGTRQASSQGRRQGGPRSLSREEGCEVGTPHLSCRVRQSPCSLARSQFEPPEPTVACHPESVRGAGSVRTRGTSVLVEGTARMLRGCAFQRWHEPASIRIGTCMAMS